jgi:hypothetical protein
MGLAELDPVPGFVAEERLERLHQPQGLDPLVAKDQPGGQIDRQDVWIDDVGFRRVGEGFAQASDRGVETLGGQGLLEEIGGRGLSGWILSDDRHRRRYATGNRQGHGPDARRGSAHEITPESGCWGPVMIPHQEHEAPPGGSTPGERPRDGRHT